MDKNAYLLSINMVSGGGRIKCHRCTARSKRTGLQGGRPDMRLSKSQNVIFTAVNLVGLRILRVRQEQVKPT